MVVPSFPKIHQRPCFFYSSTFSISSSFAEQKLFVRSLLPQEIMVLRAAESLIDTSKNRLELIFLIITIIPVKINLLDELLKSDCILRWFLWFLGFPSSPIFLETKCSSGWSIFLNLAVFTRSKIFLLKPHFKTGKKSSSLFSFSNQPHKTNYFFPCLFLFPFSRWTWPKMSQKLITSSNHLNDAFLLILLSEKILSSPFSKFYIFLKQLNRLIFKMKP